MKLLTYLFIPALAIFLVLPISSELFGQEKGEQDELLISLGINANDKLLESSGLAHSSHVENAVWTLNDSGCPNE